MQTLQIQPWDLMEQLVPPGFRFYPTEEEIISFYLNHILQGTGQDKIHRIIPSLDVYDYNPWDLPQFAGEYCRGDPEQWFFFISMRENEARGGRPSRLTDSGYWKATGSPSFVYSSGNYNRVIGVKKTMVFYQGRAPTGTKTEWKMNEYKAIHIGETSSSTTTPTSLLKQVGSICRVYTKSKYVRAFDRRPSGVNTSRLHLGGHQGESHSTALDETKNSTDQYNTNNSSSASVSNPASRNMEIMDDNNNNNNNNNVNADIGNSTNDQPLWDWEQLNWCS